MYRISEVGFLYGIMEDGKREPCVVLNSHSNAVLVMSILEKDKDNAYFNYSDCKQALSNGGIMPVAEFAGLINKITVTHTNSMDEIHIYFKVDRGIILEQLVAEMNMVVNKSSYYLKRYTTGILLYGCYDENNKWWSSNPDSINEKFGTDVVDVIVHYAVNGECSLTGAMAAISRYRLKELLPLCQIEGKFLHSSDLKECIQVLEGLSVF